ncbi:hypothetical protein [Propionivibrio sp.]|jgi:hypothetical protein|uniref:hypothetical protein n=1 Tax=Propionivibrio sp. TaxID=2212460 RepID=UPI003BEF98A0
MTDNPPVDFEAKAREPVKPAGGSPMQISASDLMKNFVFAGLQLPEDMVDEATGYNGHKARKLKGPSSGTYVLGCVNGVIQWIETEDC